MPKMGMPGDRYDVEGDSLGLLGEEPLPKGLTSVPNARLALKGAIDDRPVMYAPTAIIPIERDVHNHVESREALTRFRRAPNNGKPCTRNQPLDEVATTSAESDVVKGHEFDLRLADVFPQVGYIALHVKQPA
jgi:hypothetical protein